MFGTVYAKEFRSSIQHRVVRRTTRLGIWLHKGQRFTWVMLFCFSLIYLYIHWMWYVASMLYGTSNNLLKLDQKIDTSILINKYNFTHLNSEGTSDARTSTGVVNVKGKFEKRAKLILFWTTVYNSSDVHLKKNVFAMCPEVKCKLTEDKSLFEESAAVMIHTKDIGQFHYPLPPYKPPHHIWVFYNNEAPYYAGREVPASFYNGLFNWTFTYRSDSDIYHPYGYTMKALRDLPRLNVTKNYAEGRGGTVLWVCSHCNTAGRREMFFNELRLSVPIDVYGYCGDLNCPRGPFCDQFFKNTYKFYLAFENSLCSEYVTEKTWKVLSKWNMIPIVLGQANYTDILPKNSFIDVQNFSSAKALAKYILQVNASDELYNSYFEWKKTEIIVDESSPKHEQPWCDLCRKLHQEPIPYKVYDNFASWWNITGDCIDPNVYYRGHTKDRMERLFQLPEQYTPGHIFNFTLDGLMSEELKEQQIHQLTSRYK